MIRWFTMNTNSYLCWKLRMLQSKVAHQRHNVRAPLLSKCYVKIKVLITVVFLVGSPGPPKVIKLFSCSTQLSTKFVLLKNVKMPTIVGILIFISMIHTTSERLKASHFFICRYCSFVEQLKYCAQLSEHENSFITSGPGAKIPGLLYVICPSFILHIIAFSRTLINSFISLCRLLITFANS